MTTNDDPNAPVYLYSVDARELFREWVSADFPPTAIITETIAAENLLHHLVEYGHGPIPADTRTQVAWRLGYTGAVEGMTYGHAASALIQDRETGKGGEYLARLITGDQDR